MQLFAKMAISSLALLAALLALFAHPAVGLPILPCAVLKGNNTGTVTAQRAPSCTDDPPPKPTKPPVIPRVGGTLIAVNCPPSAGAFYVTINGARTDVLSTTVTDGRASIMPYYQTFSQGTTGPYSVVPFAPCVGGGWNPPSRSVPGSVAFAQDFVYARGFPLSLSLVGGVLTNALSGLRLRLNNYASASPPGGSYIAFGSQQVAFSIPPVVIKLGICSWWICPNLGKATIYVNDMNLRSVRIEAVGDELKISITFEDSGRELKGFHSSLGDDGIPDFQINGKDGNEGPVITAMAKIIYTPLGATVTLAPYGATLIADISSTGACNVFGVDLCDAILGTNGKIRNAIQDVLNSMLTSAMLQSTIAVKLGEYLASLGSVAAVQSWGLYNGVLYILR